MTKVVCAQPEGFQYDFRENAPAGTPHYVEVGEVVQLKGLVNDGKLMSLGYFRLFDSDLDTEEPCSCAKVFANSHLLEVHRPTHNVTHSPGLRDDPLAVKEREAFEMSRRGMENLTQKGPEAPPLDPRNRQCMICTEWFTPQGIRAHVQSCQTKSKVPVTLG